MKAEIGIDDVRRIELSEEEAETLLAVFGRRDEAALRAEDEKLPGRAWEMHSKLLDGLAPMVLSWPFESWSDADLPGVWHHVSDAVCADCGETFGRTYYLTETRLGAVTHKSDHAYTCPKRAGAAP